jgi:diguanylate cyclase (GGDEF)-like protein
MPHAASNAGPFVTVSIGLAQLEFGRTLHFEALFDEADQALYRAKAEGRNRVCYRRQDDNPNNPTVAVG